MNKSTAYLFSHLMFTNLTLFWTTVPSCVCSVYSPFGMVTRKKKSLCMPDLDLRVKCLGENGLSEKKTLESLQDF